MNMPCVHASVIFNECYKIGIVVSSSDECKMEYYVANAMPREAMLYYDEKHENSFKKRFLHGIALYLDRKYEIANASLQALKTKNASDDSELRMWQQIVQFHLDKSIAVTYTPNLHSFIEEYPDKIQDHTLLDIMESSVINRRLHSILYVNKVLSEVHLSEQNELRYQLIRGRMKEIQRDPNGAISLYDDVANGGGYEYTTEAKYRRFLLLRDMKKISITDSIRQLEEIRIDARPYDINKDILLSLVDLYLHKEEYYYALLTLQELSLSKVSNVNAVEILRQMHKIFIRAIKSSGASHKKDIKIIGVFYKFKHLMPIGDVGRDLSISIADRMERIGMYDKAADILRHIMKYRTHNKDSQCTLGVRVSKNLFDSYKLNDALSLLDDLHECTLVDLEKKIDLQIQILIHKKRYIDAMSIASQSSKRSQFISDILWRKNDWRGLIAVLQKQFEYRYDPNVQLSQIEIINFIRLFASYLAIGDIRIAQSLYVTFKDLLPEIHDKENHVGFLNMLVTEVGKRSDINLEKVKSLLRINAG